MHMVTHTRWPAATAADPDKKQTCHTAFINVAGSGRASRPFPRKTLPHNFPHHCGNPAKLLVRSPRKTLSHNFHHRGCIPRGFSHVLISVRQGPDDGPSDESFVLHRDQGPKQGTKQGNQPRLSPLRDSAPSLYIVFCILSCDSAPCPDDGSSEESLPLHQ